MRFNESSVITVSIIISNIILLPDVLSVLHLNHCKPLRAGFNRPNLVYEVQQKGGNPQAVADQIADMIKGTIKHSTHKFK